MKKEHGAWEYNWTTLSLGNINTGTWSSRLGSWTKGWTNLFCEKNIVAKSNEVKTRCNLAEFSEEGYGSKVAVFPTILIMMIMMMMRSCNLLYRINPSSNDFF
jgi:hypothetical protein